MGATNPLTPRKQTQYEVHKIGFRDGAGLMPGDSFYASRLWRKARAAFLLANPVCCVPGCGARATDVDHVRTIRSGGDRFDPRNQVAYCRSHHGQKTARRDRPSYRSDNGRLVVKGCDASGWPLDPLHGWNAAKK